MSFIYSTYRLHFILSEFKSPMLFFVIFIVIIFCHIDNLLIALSKHEAIYEKLKCVFGFSIRQLPQSTRDKIVKSSLNLIKMYQEDLDCSLSEEL